MPLWFIIWSKQTFVFNLKQLVISSAPYIQFYQHLNCCPLITNVDFQNKILAFKVSCLLALIISGCATVYALQYFCVVYLVMLCK